MTRDFWKSLPYWSKPEKTWGSPMDIGEHYRVTQNCYDDLIVLRNAWGVTSFGLDQAKQAWKTLIIMYLHCPERIRFIVQSHIDEFQRRMELIGIQHYQHGEPLLNEDDD